MARGWESKSVESQMESAAAAPAREPSPNEPTIEERARRRERECLALSRARVLEQLAAATHPRHREILEAGLRHLQEKIALLDGAETPPEDGLRSRGTASA